MVIYLCGMNEDEIIEFIWVMFDSGSCLWWDVLMLIVDKYLIGGVGDKIFMLIVLMFVELGFCVLMFFGCGLGVIGGMFDKFELFLGFEM